jgi:ATPase subunit of ABC transporter with duplicated ATPase domains
MSISAKFESETWNADAASVKNLDLSIESSTLLNNVSFTISKGDRIALLGRNGSGKSTLFHWIASHSESSPLSIYEVLQELPPSKDNIVNIVLSSHLERGKLWARQKVLEDANELSADEIKEYAANGEALVAMKAEADPPRAKKILRGLGFAADDLEKSLERFSGGWRARVALAMGLFMEPDILLLDEPTNHLDLEGVIWLSDFLSKWKKTVIVISHNVGFIDTVANTIWHLQNKALTSYKCSYNRYLKQRRLDEDRIQKEWDLFEKELKALKGKGTPAAKKQAEELTAKRMREGIVKPSKVYNPVFLFGESSISYTGALITVSDASLGYEKKPVLRNVSFSLYNGDRIALVGANGSGKSTFMKFLSGELVPMAGSAHFHSSKLKVLKFDQHFYHSLPEKLSPVDYIRGLGISDIEHIRKILGASALEGEAHTRPIETLSGGQKARVYFAGISAQHPQILLLDEPTNHLDIETVEALTNALLTFDGALIIVSHDLNFLETLATEVWQTDKRTLVQLSKDASGLTEYVESIELDSD